METAVIEEHIEENRSQEMRGKVEIRKYIKRESFEEENEQQLQQQR